LKEVKLAEEKSSLVSRVFRVLQEFIEREETTNKFLFFTFFVFASNVQLCLGLRSFFKSNSVAIHFSSLQCSRLQTAMLGYTIFSFLMMIAGIFFKILKKKDVGIFKYIFSLGLYISNIHIARFTGLQISLIPFFIIYNTTFISVLLGPPVAVFGLIVSIAIYVGSVAFEQVGFLPWISIVPDTTNFIDIFGNKALMLPFTSSFTWFTIIIGYLIIYIMTISNSKTEELIRKNEQIQRLSAKLSLYLPKLLVKLLERGESDVDRQHERVRLTIFLSDIKEFTRISELLQPEETSKILNMYLTRMSKIAEKYGGTVDKFIGDAILVYFGGIGNEEYQKNALQAIRMAIAMQDEVKSLQEQFKRDGLFLEIPFQIRIGINTGYATIGSFGSDERRDYTIIGKEVNITSRLERVCESGGILVSHPTYALTKDYIEYEDRGSVNVKGIDAPLKTYQVIRERLEQRFEGRVN